MDADKSKLTVVINSQEIDLTMDEARAMYDALKKHFEPLNGQYIFNASLVSGPNSYVTVSPEPIRWSTTYLQPERRNEYRAGGTIYSNNTTIVRGNTNE